MTGINRDYLTEQFETIAEYLKRARRIATLSRPDYLADTNAVDASVRQLTVLFEISHNIAKHLGSRFGWREQHLSAFESFATSVARWLAALEGE